jgi:hypothetical protein
MKRRQREAIVAALDAKLAERDSWCGETHLQKSVYFAQELLGVPTGFDYILYKFGPFSRELRGELGTMQADGFLHLVVQPAPYGPTLRVTDAARRQLIARWPKTLKRHGARLNFIADKLGGLGVGALERLATALWVWRESPEDDETALAQRMHDLKPHVSVESAREALRQVQAMETEASNAGLVAVSSRNVIHR